MSRFSNRQLNGFNELLLIFIASIFLAVGSSVLNANAQSTPPRFASASLIEANFRAKSFYLVGDDQVARIRAVDWPAWRSVELPFWLGIGKVVPKDLRPQPGNCYVISEAYIVRNLTEKEWLIRAGSSLQKPDAVLINTKTHYKNTGMILPTIVQYVGSRTFTRSDGSKIDIAVLEEVSLPARWTLPGRVPQTYANFSIRR